MEVKMIAQFPQGKVFIYNGEYNKKDIDDLQRIASWIANYLGGSIYILPRISSIKDPKYDIIFSGLRGTEYEGKCPDLRVITTIGNKTYVEYESYAKPFSMKKVTKMLSRGAEQASNIIIDVRGTTVTKKSVRDRIEKLKRQKSFDKTINSVWIYNGSGIEKVI